MHDKAISPKEGETQAVRQSGFIAGPLDKDALKDIFRLISAKQNSLTEVYPNPVLISIKDVEELGLLLCQKFGKYHSNSVAFSAVVSFTNYRTREYPSWESFKNGEWVSPDVIDSLTLKWEFLVQFEDHGKPCPFKITLRCGDGLKPQVMFQYMFSRDDDEIDRFEVMSAPVSCRVDFSDAIVSQEILDLVARWHKGRRSPETLIPGVNFVRKNHGVFSKLVRFLTPVFTAFLLLSWLHKALLGVNEQATVTNEFLAISLVWLCAALVLISFSAWLGNAASMFLERTVMQIGRTHTLEFTNGDKNFQTKMFGRSQRSFWKFCGAGFASILWNIVAAIVAFWWLPAST